MKSWTTALIAVVLILGTEFASAQASAASSAFSDLKTFTEIPAVSGYETDLIAKIRKELGGFSPQSDDLGDLIVTIGSGSPHRLLVTSVDEPGFVVSAITNDGYLRLQRLPQQGLSSLWNELYSAQPVLIRTRNGKLANGAVAGLSVHLQPGRQHAPDLGDLDNIWVDVGATSADEARAAGIDVLEPLALDRTLYQVGSNKLSGTAVENRFGAAALLQVLRDLDRSKLKGTLTVAFLNQQWTGSRGLIRLLQQHTDADELLFVGPLHRPLNGPSQTQQKTGSGVVVAEGSSADALASLKQIGGQRQVAVNTQAAAPLIGRSYLAAPKMPALWAHIGIPVAWANMPSQYIDARDFAGLIRLVEQYAQGEAKEVAIPSTNPLPEQTAGGRPANAPTNADVLKRVIESSGASDHEAPVADTIAALLPPWAKPVKDKAGNLILHWTGNNKGQGIAIVAHQDEIGFEVKSITADGRLELINKGGGTPAFFAGHQVLFHTANGVRAAVLELPQGWDQPKFEWGSGREFQFIADVGAISADEAAKFGFKVGDWATVPKKYRPLIGTRASARSFDDRMGCAALIAAAWKLGPDLGGRDVTFVWSTGEELGLVGAGAFATERAAEGNPPAYVFAIDTFVSADSPIESKRFGNALVGHGFVIRAVDNSNIVPSDAVNKLIALMNADRVPVQYGVTGGGNDGSAFLRYGTVDVAMGWPLRYSHSPAEVIDLKDLDSLTNAVVSVSRRWVK